MLKLNEIYRIMNMAVIREKLRHTGFFIPFRIHFVLVVISLFFAGKWVQQNNAVPETARTAIINVFLTVTFWFALVILFISFFSACIPWIFFLINKKNKKVSLTITTPVKDITTEQELAINIAHITKPAFGYIRLRLFYDGNNISPKFAPINKKTNYSFYSKNINGAYKWPLKNIKEYDISKAIIYFEDFFQFFSFTTILSAKSNFFKHPLQKSIVPVIVQPKKTDETNMRIEEMRKVEGEFLNYKNFENNDDVRRIVWKIYAKNKELVVRIPETNDPYASHIYFYTSFYNAVSNEMNSAFNAAFLDYFKTIAWNVFEQLYKQHNLVQYIPDQETKTFYADDILQKVKYIISTSQWQQQNDLLKYFNKQYGSLLCISSFTDARQLSEIIDKTGKSLTIIFVPLSNIFKTVKVSDWIQWLFIKPEKKSVEKLQLSFNLSPLRRNMLENEKSIEAILNKSDCEVLVINN